MTNTMRPEATANYRTHPMGYACVDCGQAAHVGDAVHHSSRCDIAPRKAVFPAWPTTDELADIDERIAQGDPEADVDAKKAVGLLPKLPTGKWTKWRKTDQWAIALPETVAVGDVVCVVRGDETISEAYVGEILWSGEDGRTIVLPARSEVYAPPTKQQKKDARAFRRMRYAR